MNAYTLHGQVWDWLGQLTGTHSCCPNRAEELFLFYPKQKPFYRDHRIWDHETKRNHNPVGDQ